MRFQVETGEHDPPSWWLIDDDGHPMAWAGVHFSSLAAADQAAHQFRTEAESAVIEVDPVAELGWRWSAWLGTDNRVSGLVWHLPREGIGRPGGSARP